MVVLCSVKGGKGFWVMVSAVPPQSNPTPQVRERLLRVAGDIFYRNGIHDVWLA